MGIMHHTAMEFVENAFTEYRQSNDWNRSKLLVEFGAYDVNGSIRELFTNASINYIGVDLQAGPGVNIVKDAAQITPADLNGKLADIVVTTNVFEHVEDWEAIVSSAYGILKEGGWFIVQCAGPGFGAHSDKIESTELEPDEWYRNVPHEELQAAMLDAGFKNVKTRWRDEWPHDTFGQGIK